MIAFISIQFECSYAERACKVRALARANADGWQSGRLRRAVNPFLSLDAQVRILLHLVNIDIKNKLYHRYLHCIMLPWWNWHTHLT